MLTASRTTTRTTRWRYGATARVSAVVERCGRNPGSRPGASIGAAASPDAGLLVRSRPAVKLGVRLDVKLGVSEWDARRSVRRPMVAAAIARNAGGADAAVAVA